VKGHRDHARIVNDRSGDRSPAFKAFIFLKVGFTGLEVGIQADRNAARMVRSFGPAGAFRSVERHEG
jgi:hypothetical protein